MRFLGGKRQIKNNGANKGNKMSRFAPPSAEWWPLRGCLRRWAERVLKMFGWTEKQTPRLKPDCKGSTYGTDKSVPLSGTGLFSSLWKPQKSALPGGEGNGCRWRTVYIPPIANGAMDGAPVWLWLSGERQRQIPPG